MAQMLKNKSAEDRILEKYAMKEEAEKLHNKKFSEVEKIMDIKQKYEEL
jgi:hypothetical protein